MHLSTFFFLNQYILINTWAGSLSFLAHDLMLYNQNCLYFFFMAAGNIEVINADGICGKYTN